MSNEHDLPFTSLSEQKVALLEDARERLQNAAQALSNISGIVPDVAYADWNHKTSRKLPLKFMQWMLNHFAEKLNARIHELRGES